MPKNGSLPSYERLFGDLDFRAQDESRTVYSPAAYLADLLQLLDDNFTTPALTQPQRRPDLKKIVLDGENTFTGSPYLDLVNEVLGNLISDDPDEKLTTLHFPFDMPFSLRHERLKKYLNHLQVSPVELYRLFASNIDADVVAREYLGLSPEDVDIVTRANSEPDLKRFYQLGERESFKLVEDVDRFRRATLLTPGELRELLFQNLSSTATDGAAPERSAASRFFIHRGGTRVTLDPDEKKLVWGGATDSIPFVWFDRVNRFVRLARKTNLSLTDLDLILRTCCENSIDLAALRTIAIVIHIQRVSELPIDVVCSLIAPITTMGIGDEAAPQDLFNRIFNTPFANPGQGVIQASAFTPPAYAGRQVLTSSGDLLAARNQEYRRRVAQALAMTESDITLIVTRFRQRASATASQPSPFDSTDIGLSALSLLHRISRLVTALDISVEELFGVLDALEGDPSLRWYSTFPILIGPTPADTGPRIQDCYRALDAADVGSRRWLMQLLFAVVPWMQATGFTSRELIQVLGGAPARASGPVSSEDEQTTVLQSLREQFETVALAPELFVSQRFSQRASEVIYSALAARDDGVVSHRDERLLRIDPTTAESAAYDAIADLDAIVKDDFLELGLGERLTEKIFVNLVVMGYLESNGALVESKLPSSPADFRLTSDFSSYRDALFALIYGFCVEGAEAAVSDEAAVPDGEPEENAPTEDAPDYGAEEDYSDYGTEEDYSVEELESGGELDGPQGMASFFLSDLAALGDLTIAEQDELYHNLIFNGYVDTEGKVLRPEFFTQPENVAVFAVNANVGDIASEVLARLQEPVDRFRNERLALDPEIFAALALSDARLADLLENLRFNGYLDQKGFYTGTKVLVECKLDDLRLALEFYPYRQGVLDAMRAQIRQSKAQMCTFAPEDFQEIADGAVAQQVVDQLDGTYLHEDRVPRDVKAFFADPDSQLEMGEGFTASDRATILHRVSTILQEQQAYHLDPAALTEVGFDTDEREQLLALLINAGHLNDELTVPESRLAYFSNVNNALDFSIAGLQDYHAGLQDYHKDIFFLLHAVAMELRAGITEITATLAAQAGRQSSALFAVVQDAFGVTASTAAAICSSVVGSTAEALELLVGAALAAADGASSADSTSSTSSTSSAMAMPVVAAGTGTGEPAATEAHLAYRRIRSFALLAARLGLDATEVSVAFQDQDLVGKFPESLALPPGVDRFDALLPSAEGNIYLFSAGNYWVYSAATYLLADKQPKPLDALSNQFAGLTGIDAAFTDASGTEWIIGRAPTGSHAFVKEPGGRRWARKEQVWGKVKNNFADPARIDSAFVDDEGKTYLFCGDQYVRYSGRDYTYVDEGYPRRIGEWWEGEGRNAQLPERFRVSLDASFQGHDGKTHLFKGDRCLAVGDGSVEGSIPEVWGRVRNTFTEAGRVDAAYSTDSGYLFFSGNQLVRYSDSIENDGVRVDDGYPRQIGSHLPNVPAEFEGALDAAFVDRAGVLHLFKDGKTISLKAGGDTVVPTAQRWGLLGPILPSGTVDSAFVGLDGNTYLFSGDQYLRYSGADYSVVDVGYPRSIVGDWGGLRRVDASFVLDGVTYLFGTGVNGGTAYVRYSTRNYAAPDTGYPQPLSGNWWNLPAGLVEDGAFTTVDAVFTGRDNRTYLFSGGHFVVFDNKYRWWSEPQTLRQHWDSIPFSFSRIDAAFVGKDGKTYVFSGQQYIRYSNGDYTQIDDRYPAPISTFWCNVLNNIARTGRVDAALVVDSPETVGGVEVAGEHTYLFSGNQYVRYSGREYTTVDDGYPKSISSLAQEPRFRNLQAVLDRGVDAAIADRRNVYLFTGRHCHVVSDASYRRYSDLGLHLGFAAAGCAFVEDGAVLVEEPDGWHRYSALEATTVTKSAVRPRTLRTVPPEFQSGLDAVLQGADKNTYLFKGTSCFNVALNRQYPFAEDWGRPRNNIYHGNVVDAAFVGRDGRTYVFSGDQFVVYPGADYLGAEIEGEPRAVAAHWAGLTSVALAYVQDERTYLFEKADAGGYRRYLVYSGTDYTQPDVGYPQTTDSSFWAIPDEHRTAGFPVPEAVLFEGDNMLLLAGQQYLQFHQPTGTWSYPRPLSRLWPDIGRELAGAAGPTSAFTGADGATYFFFANQFTRYYDRSCSPRRPIREIWGRARNNFVATGTGPNGAGRRGTVDAAFVYRGQTTFLFSGDQYVRYSGADYRYVDPGYPKLIARNLRTEEAFSQLPDSFEDIVADRIASGAGAVIDAVVANDRTISLFIGGDCHVVSRTVTATYDIGILGRVRNTIADRKKVDAALVAGAHTFLFSGDQYVRYSGADYAFVDDGYPRTLASSLPAELGIAALPAQFHDGIDAAFRGTDGHTYLFTGRQYLRIDGAAATPAAATPVPVKDVWGTVRNAFTAGENITVDAAFVGPTGELYVFSRGQYARYRPGAPEFVEEGFPRLVKDNWGNLPPAFEVALDGAFVFEGRTYLVKGDQYVRYSGHGYDAIDRTYPQTFRQRWSDSVDYRLNDIWTIVRFAELNRAHPSSDGGLAAFLTTGPATVEDPYRYLSELFGWDIDELKWVKRRGGFLPAIPQFEERFELEFVLKLVDMFAVAGKLGTGPSTIFADVWSRLHAARPSEVERAQVVSVLHDLLARRHSPQDWLVLSRQLRDECNVLKRDALVSAVLAHRPDLELRNSRDLFEHLLIDVDMGSRGTTSRIREAIAATQLYLHRYFLDLEPVTVRDGEEKDDVKRRLKTWWTWMRNYRVWEANRKVFLYPENYLRPELRATKTPAFHALESDLLQGEITPIAVERAYKRYLDEYTEVSRLAIAGGYVYAEDGSTGSTGGTPTGGTRNLILFGRTRTDPRQYYYRRAEFRDGGKLSTTWAPWLKVGVQIDADNVHPVHAFGRVFVFWAVVESVAPDEAASTTVVARTDGDKQQVSATPPTSCVKICYSFYDLNGEWVPPQTLATDDRRAGPISDLRLFVQKSETLSGLLLSGDDHESIIVTCTYTVPTPPGSSSATSGTAAPSRESIRTAFTLTPELYAVRLYSLRADGAVSDTSGIDLFQEIFDEPAGPAQPDPQKIDATSVVRFNSPTSSLDAPWFSFDHKGGSFLCRPAVSALARPIRPISLKGNSDRLPEWERIDAAFELDQGTRYFFDNATHSFVSVAPQAEEPGDSVPIADRWGNTGNTLSRTGAVDAIIVRGDYTYIFSGHQYFRYTGSPFGMVDDGYPRDIETNTENFPQWQKIDAAFTGLDGVEYFFSHDQNRFVQSTSLETLLETLPVFGLRWGQRAASDNAQPDKTQPDDAQPDNTQPDNTRRGRSRRSAAPVFGTGKVDAALVDPVNEHTYLFSGDEYVRYSGRQYRGIDPGYPRKIEGNDEGFPSWKQIDAALWRERTTYFFDNATQTYSVFAPRRKERTHQTRRLGTETTIAWSSSVDAAYVNDGQLYLTCGAEFVRYTLGPDEAVPEFVDAGYPKAMPGPVDAVFRQGGHLYAFRGSNYTRIGAGQELDAMAEFKPIKDSWGDLPIDFRAGVDAALDSPSALYLFLGGHYVEYPKTTTVARPYERSAVPFEIIRLTTSTAYKLNQRLLSGGVGALLDLWTQETDELPAFSIDMSDATTIKVREQKVVPARLPASSHLDFQSANGVYYWEIFFHAPLLIAQALNNAQRFEDARQWYEYIFDPTESTGYWRFLPFLAVDARALVDSCRSDVQELSRFGLDVTGVQRVLDPVLAALERLAPAFQQSRTLTANEDADLMTVVSSKVHADLAEALRALAGSRLPAKAAAAIRSTMAGLQERIAIIAGLKRQYDLMGDHESLVKAYLEDPFDPHAIADLRPLAHRRAVVMGYIDNLLDWGDLLFRQYTAESIDEARMLYIFAYDLLGERPESLGARALPPARHVGELTHERGKYDLELVGDDILLAELSEVHRSVASPYFFIPPNSAFGDYWVRVEDRLRKIRQSLNIMGISQPVPLFEPPIDPMALVRSVASGAELTSVTSSPVPVPPYRFAVVFRKAQELVDKLRQFGNDLLSVLERRDAEELSLLQNRQEGVILAMTRSIKETQVQIATEQLRELEASRDAASERVGYYQRLVTEGLSGLEKAQIEAMTSAFQAHMASAGIKIASAIAFAVPRVKIGPFIIGTEFGGDQLGEIVDKAADIAQSLGEAFSVQGELLGARAQHERSAQDWTYQLNTARSDLVQIGHQLTSAEHQLAVTRREAEVLAQEIAHNESIATFMTDKFANAQLYQWMSGRLSALYFQAYGMAYDMARSAERAFQFEGGVSEGEVAYIQPLYWESRRNGLLAGESLGLDLERLGKAYLDTGSRGLEITKRISLLELDPVALLRLSSSGVGEFALTEALFDYDFPGHFRRQIRTMTVTFEGPDGTPVQLNATLTQVGHKTVIAADPKAVKYLLEPNGLAPDTLRSDWRPNQQIALSHVEAEENNGLFELRFDDDRYLPFEGTGAVSTWRLELGGKRPTDLRDVTITLKYTAEQGGEVFANAVKGMLKPYPAARFFDVASEFPQEWEEFLGNGEQELALPFTPEMFPSMSSRQITGIYPKYECGNGDAARFVLNGDKKLTLNDGKLLPTPGLRVSGNGVPSWYLALDGDKEALRNLGLVLTYQASVQ